MSMDLPLLDVEVHSCCYVAMERPNAGTDALLLSRVALAKEAWLTSIGVEAEWPMHGLAQVAASGQCRRVQEPGPCEAAVASTAFELRACRERLATPPWGARRASLRIARRVVPGRAAP